MRRLTALPVFIALAASVFGTHSAQAEPPKGELTKHSFDKSKIFPGTTREYWVYVPKQYDPAKPACVHVNQDGIQYNAPAVFDALIEAKKMPVTIGVFVMHGRVKAESDQALDRFNRSYEYDGLGDHYAKFLLDELLPEVETLSTADGRKIALSHSGNDRSIAGASSGAIAAFTAAWEHPDAFTRVFSSIGTYVGLRGGNVYPTLIRKYEPKPIRIFLQDGDHDLNIYGGDWWMANQEMERAFIFSGYEVNHVWGTGGHDGKQATEVFPEAVEWLWKGWPEPVKAGLGSPQLRDILIPGEGWSLVGEGYSFTEGPAANAKGEVIFTDIPQSKAYKIEPEGKPSVYIDGTKRANGQAYGPDGTLYAVSTETTAILVYKDGKKTGEIALDFKGNDIVVNHKGDIYVTNPDFGPNKQGRVILIKNGEPKIVDTGLKYPNGIAFSPDQSLLYVSDYQSHWVYSYQVAKDGTLQHKQKYYHLHVPDSADNSAADGMKVDRDGRLYVTTNLGIQVCDQAGRVNAIIPTPNGKAANITFGGPNFDIIYVTSFDKVYKRKVKPKGANAFEAPIKPAAPRL